MILIYICESDVDAYITQGWQAWRLLGHHGARKGANMRTFIAILDLAPHADAR